MNGALCNIIPTNKPCAAIIKNTKANKDVGLTVTRIFATFLNDNGIQTGIHYPIPCHLQKSYEFLGISEGAFPVSENWANEILSLPMSEQLKEEEIKYISEKVKEFFIM